MVGTLFERDRQFVVLDNQNFTIMKNVIFAIVAMILFSGCALSKKIQKSEKSTQTKEKTTETTSDSTSTIQKSQPTESEIVLDIETLSKMIGDFEQRVASGDGNESVITKKDGKLTIRNRNSGSTNAQTKVKNTKTETEYNSEFIIKETRKIISRFPWWVWVAVVVWLLIIFRKVIAQLLIFMFPPLAGARLLQLFIGHNPKN